MYSEVKSVNISGLSAQIVTVETDAGLGLPVFEMSGYLAGEIKEARERVRVAIKNSGFELRPQRIIVNISPADIRKDGTGFDLPIAIGILAANGIVSEEALRDIIIIGELSLDGSVNSVNGILPSVCAAFENHYRMCIVPYDNLKEGQVVSGIKVYGVKSLRELVDFLDKKADENEYKDKFNIEETEICKRMDCVGNQEAENRNDECQIDYSDIKGQTAAKRATMIAVAGMHNIMYVGAPGSGKTMLAKRIPTIMPGMTFEERLELTKIYSIAGELDKDTPLLNKRPFRAPHHNITSSALLGGGRIPKPGEITLAGKGVLFLDEMTEYQSTVMESMRQPLEDKKVTIVRMNYAYTYPADFMLAAAINPCKCGYYPDRSRCTCTEHDIRRFLGRISQPMWDRFDLCVQVQKVRLADMTDSIDTEYNKDIFNNSDYVNRKSKEFYNSDNMRECIEKARAIQIKRFEGRKIHFNAEMNSGDVKKYCELDLEGKMLMEEVYDKLNLTARGYIKVLKLARTIADIDGEKDIKKEHLSEALSYRTYDSVIRI